jgi:hypothetical protein
MKWHLILLPALTGCGQMVFPQQNQPSSGPVYNVVTRQYRPAETLSTMPDSINAVPQATSERAVYSRYLERTRSQRAKDNDVPVGVLEAEDRQELDKKFPDLTIPKDAQKKPFVQPGLPTD